MITESRLLELCHVELFDQLVPVIHHAFVGSLKDGKPAPLLITKTILSNSTIALAYGYRFHSRVRSKLTKDIDHKDGTKPAPPGKVLEDVVTRRANTYMKFVHRVAKHRNHRVTETREILEIIGQALQQDGRDETMERLKWAVSRVTNVEELHEPLSLYGRLFVDRELDAALLLLDAHGKELPLPSKTVELLEEYVVKRLVKHITRISNGGPASPDPMDVRLQDPSTFFWGLLLLSRNAVLLEQLRSGLAIPLKDVLASWSTDRNALNVDDAVMANMEAPEIYAGTYRSDSYCLYDLRHLDRTVFADEASALDSLQKIYSERILGKFDLTAPSSDVSPRRNLHVLACLVFALSDGVAPNIAEREQGTLISVLPWSHEINLADHRLFGDYLCWSGSDDSQKIDKTVERLKTVLRAYASGKTKRPLNILLCGKPGTGKSFFVKNLIADIDKLKSLKPIEINASQLSDVGDLARKLRPITSQIAEHGIAVLFLDEADTEIRQGEYLFPRLLAPMWDGEFAADGDLTAFMKRTICFFAASKEDTVDKLRGWLSPDDRTIVTPQKSRDFWSRLYIEEELEEPGAEANVLVFLSNLLRHHQPEKAFVTRRLLRFLATNHFTGGARDIEKAVALLELPEQAPLDLTHLHRSYQESPRVKTRAGDAWLGLDESTWSAIDGERISIVDL